MGMRRCGRLYIPLAPPVMQHSFGRRPPLCRTTYTRTVGFCSWQILSFVPLPATKSACSAAAVKCLSGVGQPLSSVSGRKRYNTKSACSAAAVKCLSGVGQPLSSVSGRKRYNTLDFAEQNRVPTGMLSPLLETQRRGDDPLWTPFFFTQRRSNCENPVCHRCEENAKGSICARIVKAQIFLLTLTI